MLNKILLRNFRNYEFLELGCASEVNVFIGQNGEGKTNLLEAIYFLSYLRTFRDSSTRNIKTIGKRDLYAASEIQTRNGWRKFIEIDINEKKTYKIDGFGVKKTSDFIMSLRPVVFKYDDIELITGGASNRRKFIDLFISSLYKPYLSLVKDYYIALYSRNSLLRNKEKNKRCYLSFEVILAENAEQIINIRTDFIENLSRKTKSILEDIKETEINYEVRYNAKNKNSLYSINDILEHYEKEREKDLRNGFTGSGPHMDDIEFILNGKNLRNFGSIGQCRVVSISNKLAMMELLMQNNDDGFGTVIALIDDITGELDLRTKSAFFRVISKVKQVYITMTNMDNCELLKNPIIYTVHNGTVVYN